VIVELALDVARKIFHSATQHIEVFTEVLDSQPVGFGVMAPDPDFSAASIRVRASSSPTLREPS
jgi:hypothetical protein